MPSNQGAEDGLFVWVWLPNRTEPVVAGRLFAQPDGVVAFLYGQSYLKQPGAIPIYLPELPLQGGPQRPGGMLKMHGSIRDASPDAWGRRVIINRLTGTRRADADTVDFSEMTYLAESGSDRIGALDFQTSSKVFRPREVTNTPLEELSEAVALVDRGVRLTPALERALNHGTAIGGARPKALVIDGERKFIAKFSARSDLFGVVQAEFFAMRLAALAGLNVAAVRMAKAANKDVVLIERFDRTLANAGWTRRAMVSALTMQGLDEMEARYASYEAMAEIMRQRFVAPVEALRDLFGRIVFNILVGNTDDHARNHAAFWDGAMLIQTPAYDICPQTRSGGEASQAMAIVGDDRRSQIATCLSAAGIFGLSRHQAEIVVEAQLDTIRLHWADVSDQARMTDVDRLYLAGRPLLNPYAFEGLTGTAARLGVAARAIREAMRRGRPA
jgi:serine/threonine-protein kinase HipA